MSILTEIFSCVVLLGVSLYSIVEYSKKAHPVPFLYGTFLISAAYAALGLLKSGCDNCDNLRKLREIFLFLIPVIGLPCVISEVWAKHKVVQEEFLWVHLGIGVLLTVLKYGYENMSKDTFDTAVGINLLSLIGVSLAYEEYYTAICGLIFIMAHYGAHEQHNLRVGVPAEDLYNYCIASYVLCASLSATHGK